MLFCSLRTIFVVVVEDIYVKKSGSDESEKKIKIFKKNF